MAEHEPDDVHMAAESDIEDDLDDLDDDLHWVLGFPEPALHPCDLLRHAFPSKVGGRPAWLDPVRLPSAVELRCPVDGSVMRFLLQVYAPVEERPEAFHRTMFVFVSGRKAADTEASAGGAGGSVCVRALRCQMARENEFYVHHPLSDAERLAGPKQVQALGGAAGGHPVPADPWSVAAHEQAVVAGRGDPVVGSGLPSPPLFPEYEIVIEEEPDDQEGTAGAGAGTGADGDVAIAQHSHRQTDEEKLAALSNAANNYTEEELPTELIDELEKNMPLDKRQFAMFAARISNAPSQILRYCFEEGAAPICPSPEGMPRPQDIPPCESCGAARRFEFQVMPQLLNILGVDPADDDALDFGTIAVYSCSASCGGDGYKHEFVWVGKS